jgi:ribose 5-phosphate isomerase B
LALGAYIAGPQLAVDIMDTLLSTDFSNGERHVRRVGKIENV